VPITEESAYGLAQNFTLESQLLQIKQVLFNSWHFSFLLRLARQKHVTLLTGVS